MKKGELRLTGLALLFFLLLQTAGMGLRPFSGSAA